MENNKSKGILVSDTQLVDILDKYEFLMLHLNTQITPTINKMIQLQKEVQNLDVILNKTKEIENALNQINLKIENSTNQILSEKIDEAVKINIDEKSKILDEIIQKQNQKIYKKELLVIATSFLFLGILIGCFL
ncbi:hypothetical protein [Arcobacter defluvii]|uniref:Uncharacterized protein n=1 Tax=Arcobacter defluvii TaxID=873191 RepID=A0AAE7E7G0_9BACT|nr:hypothetical protein [Arcobacter defluvii]QKF77318.1 hypothetical protein ADFLV_1286 [Arcobacter defluvii]RXI29630.1 hypothetical protein CP964_13365 [Arcobacter defluvii]